MEQLNNNSNTQTAVKHAYRAGEFEGPLDLLLHLIKTNKKGSFNSSKPFVFVFPVYVSNMAKPFADFLRNSEFSGNSKKALHAIVYATLSPSEYFATRLKESMKGAGKICLIFN